MIYKREIWFAGEETTGNNQFLRPTKDMAFHYKLLAARNPRRTRRDAWIRQKTRATIPPTWIVICLMKAACEPVLAVSLFSRIPPQLEWHFSRTWNIRITRYRSFAIRSLAPIDLFLPRMNLFQILRMFWGGYDTILGVSMISFWDRTRPNLVLILELRK